jgi:hypothetical protein
VTLPTHLLPIYFLHSVVLDSISPCLPSFLPSFLTSFLPFVLLTFLYFVLSSLFACLLPSYGNRFSSYCSFLSTIYLPYNLPSIIFYIFLSLFRSFAHSLNSVPALSETLPFFANTCLSFLTLPLPPSPFQSKNYSLTHPPSNSHPFCLPYLFPFLPTHFLVT